MKRRSFLFLALAALGLKLKAKPATKAPQVLPPEEIFDTTYHEWPPEPGVLPSGTWTFDSPIYSLDDCPKTPILTDIRMTQMGHYARQELANQLLDRTRAHTSSSMYELE